MASYIPRSLADVYDPERDVAVLKSGKGDDLIYKDVVGLDLQNRGGPSEGAKGVHLEEDASDDEDEEEDDDDAEGTHEKKPRGFRHEDKDAKKERKKALKEENREKRKTKMPKAEKQRRVKQTASK